MSTIRAFTTIEQNRKLADILPLESADMWYDNDGESIAGRPEVRCGSFVGLASINIPCWSLAALLSVLPFPVLYMEMVAGMMLWCCECHLIETDEVVKIEHYDNPVDACYEMILKLHELKML